MTDHLADSPVVIPNKCPDCYPDDDYRTYTVYYCEAHSPDREGADDAIVTTGIYLTGNSEATGEDNRKWCAWLHRNRREETK